MSELRHRYDRAAVSDQIIQPPFAELADRGRRRAHRTRTLRLAGVAVLAALVAAPLLTLPGQGQSGTPGGSSPPTWGPHEAEVLFFDLDYGVARYDGEACGEGWFSVTRDGGATWSGLRELPDVPYVDADGEMACSRYAVVPIAPDTLLMPGTPPPSVLPDPPPYLLTDRSTLISHDAGHTWREYEPRVRTAESVPDGVIPSWPCDEEQCKEAGLGWYDPQSGDWMVLEHQPQGVEYDSVYVGFDGSIWVSGIGAGGAGPFRLSVSWDRGRSWVDRTPEEDLGFDPNLRTPGGDIAYLHSAQGDPRADSFQLYRTTDGGETWHQLPGVERFEGVVDIWMNRDGGLVLETLDDPYLSTDGGETFARTELPVQFAGLLPDGGLVGWPRDRVAADPVDLYLSEDGVTWQPVEVPHVTVPDDAPDAPQTPDR